MTPTVFEAPGSSARTLIPKRVLAVSLASFYVLAFVLSPYWMFFHSQSSAVPALALTMALGGVWFYSSAADVPTNSSGRTWLGLAGVVIAMLVLNCRMLRSVIPWRGDEDYHISMTMALMHRIPPVFAVAAPLLVLGVVLAIARQSYPLIAASVLLNVLAIGAFLMTEPFEGMTAESLARYPYVNYWLYAFVPLLAGLFVNPYDEVLYRIVPVLSAAMLVWILVRSVSGSKMAVSLLWGISIATIPILWYYSSILYIELPAVFLMTAVCLDANALLSEDPGMMRQRPAWIALILIGFIKETTIVFLLCFLVCRLVFSIKRLGRELAGSNLPRCYGTVLARLLRQELPVVFGVLVPLALFAMFRVAFDITRGFVPEFTNLLDPVVYNIGGRSWIEQFGVFAFLPVGGLCMLWSNRQYRVSVFLVLVIAANSLFDALDWKTNVGYSRYNLLLLPPILASAAVLVRGFSRWKSMAAGILVSLAIMVNLLISPIYLDGTKKPHWGNYLVDTSEHYYPYDIALTWLRDNCGRQSVLFSGMDYFYSFGFYFSQLGWSPSHDILYATNGENDSLNLAAALGEAERQHVRMVLFHPRGRTVPADPSDSRYRLAKVFQNEAHILALFARSPSCALPTK